MKLRLTTEMYVFPWVSRTADATPGRYAEAAAPEFVPPPAIEEIVFCAFVLTVTQNISSVRTRLALKRLLRANFENEFAVRPAFSFRLIGSSSIASLARMRLRWRR